MLWISRQRGIIATALMLFIFGSLLLAITLFPSVSWYLVLVTLILCLATLHLVLWSNLRKHIEILSRQINAVQSLGSLQSMPLQQPAFLLTHSVSPDLLVLLGEFIRRFHINRVLELGSGASSLYLTNMLQYFHADGTLISLEDSEAWQQLIQAELDIATLGKHVSAQVLYAPVSKLKNQTTNQALFYSLPSLLTEQKKGFDLVFIDGPSDVNHRIHALDVLLPYVAQDCIIVWDDGEQSVIRTSIEKFVEEHSDWSFKYYKTIKGTCVMYRGSNNLPLP